MLFVALEAALLRLPARPARRAARRSRAPRSTATELACPACGARYDVRRAGRGVDAPELHLEPVPLLVDADGVVRVALGARA